jgi:hypothetical protein
MAAAHPLHCLRAVQVDIRGAACYIMAIPDILFNSNEHELACDAAVAHAELRNDDSPEV